MSILSPHHLDLSRRLLGILVLYDLFSRYTTTFQFVARDFPDNTNTTISHALCHLHHPPHPAPLPASPPLPSPSFHFLANATTPLLHKDVVRTYFGTSFSPFFDQFHTTTIVVLGLSAGLWSTATGSSCGLWWCWCAIAALQDTHPTWNHFGDQYLRSLLFLHGVYGVASVVIVVAGSGGHNGWGRVTKYWGPPPSLSRTLRRRLWQARAVRDVALLFLTTQVYYAASLFKLNSIPWGTTTTTAMATTATTEGPVWGSALRDVLHVKEWTTAFGQGILSTWCDAAPAPAFPPFHTPNSFTCYHHWILWLSPCVVVYEVLGALYLIHSFALRATVGHHTHATRRHVRCSVGWLLGFHAGLVLLFRFGMTFHGAFIVGLLGLWDTKTPPPDTPSPSKPSPSLSPPVPPPLTTRSSWSVATLFVLICGLHTMYLLFPFTLDTSPSSSSSSLSWNMFAPNPIDADIRLVLVQHGDPFRLFEVYPGDAASRTIRHYATKLSMMYMNDLQLEYATRALVHRLHCPTRAPLRYQLYYIVHKHASSHPHHRCHTILLSSDEEYDTYHCHTNKDLY